MIQTTQPLVTIVISCYNHERYIEAAINSVLAQTYPHIQFMVFDDGSKDKSAEIIRGLAEKHRFEFECQENIRLSNTLNKAIARAKGKYFVSFGSDDIMLPDRIEKQVAFMQAHPEFPISGGNVIFIDQDGQETNKQALAAERTLDFDDIFLNRKPGIHAASAMVETELLRLSGGYDSSIPLEDMSMWFKLLSGGSKAIIMADALAYYRKHPANTYKNVSFMLDSLLKTIKPYQNHPQYQAVKNRMLISHFLAASRQDAALAWRIFKQIDKPFYSTKVLRGLFRTGLTALNKTYMVKPWTYSPLLLLAIVGQTWIPVLLFLIIASRIQGKQKNSL